MQAMAPIRLLRNVTRGSRGLRRGRRRITLHVVVLFPVAVFAM